MSDDDARLSFLSTLQDALLACDAEWQFAFDKPHPFHVVSLVASAPGQSGELVVVPVSSDGRAKSYGSFPGPSRPHYQLFRRPPGRTLQSGPTTCVLEEAVAFAERWRASDRAAAAADKAVEGPITVAIDLEPERARLARLAESLVRPIEVVVEPCTRGLTEWGTSLVKALAIEPSAIARDFPRDDDGRLALRVDVLLERLDTTEKLGRGRSLYLIARGPTKRRDPPIIRVVVDDAIGANAAHRWTEAPASWRKDAAHAARSERWGVEESVLEPCDETGALRARDEAANEIRRRVRIADGRKAAASLWFIDRGRFDVALEMYGFTLDQRVKKLLLGVGDHIEAWTTSARRELWTLAPWKLAAILGAHGRLQLLPHQTTQVKAGLFLRNTEITIESSGANDRLAEEMWKRPAELDLYRFGLLSVPAAPKPRRRIIR